MSYLWNWLFALRRSLFSIVRSLTRLVSCRPQYSNPLWRRAIMPVAFSARPVISEIPVIILFVITFVLLWQIEKRGDHCSNIGIAFLMVITVAITSTDRLNDHLAGLHFDMKLIRLNPRYFRSQMTDFLITLNDFTTTLMTLKHCKTDNVVYSSPFMPCQLSHDGIFNLFVEHREAFEGVAH